MATTELHPGLVIIVPNVISKMQREFFDRVLDSTKKWQLTDLMNQVVEVDFNGVTIYDVPQPR
jgi:hypothetical protein